jgi:hypothetical protein
MTAFRFARSLPRLIALRQKRRRGMGAAAPIVKGVVGFGSPSGPKLQAAGRRLSGYNGGFAAQFGRLGDPSLPFIFEGRCRANCPGEFAHPLARWLVKQRVAHRSSKRTGEMREKVG